ncbi:MAG: SlyX family protein [Candidatus Thioglobus sp.]|jgi:SlyX protein|nr:SlyX family protein [Candidatus Pseudothioglobus aerophilus]MBT4245630.1 SlyX family protein [Gammaproteobacteria bacterium]MBT4587339.1 SlyX family protein [Gammaproteobacteria bacterium]MBT4974241.1 SlyX family protein [Gammaproteobacteria bacterium]MBT5407363.1 SlyX family protein [Gammaproteobacteria bacterium]
MPDNKLIELEEKISYLQNMLDELNMVIFRQGEKIEKLTSQIKETNEKIISQSESQPEQSVVLDDKPPHY